MAENELPLAQIPTAAPSARPRDERPAILTVLLEVHQHA